MLLNSHRNKNFLKFSIVHDLELLMDWFDVNQHSLNLLKMVIINFWDDGKSDGVCVHGITIPVVENTKFLGVHLDYKITWTKHTYHLHKKLMANKMLLTNSHNFLSTYCLKSIYYAHIFSHLTYGLLIWGPMVPKKIIKELSQIQDACIHVVCKQPKSSDVIPLYHNLKTLQLKDLITLELVKYGYKISHKLYPTRLHKLAESNGGLKQH